MRRLIERLRPRFVATTAYRDTGFSRTVTYRTRQGALQFLGYFPAVDRYRSVNHCSPVARSLAARQLGFWSGTLEDRRTGEVTTYTSRDLRMSRG